MRGFGSYGKRRGPPDLRMQVACLAVAALACASALEARGQVDELLGEAHARPGTWVLEWMEHVFELYVAGHISEAELLWVAMIGYLDDADTDGQVSDREILSALQFLVDNGIVRAVEVYADEGDFYVKYGSSASYADAAEYLLDTYLLEDNAEWLNENYKLPYDVPIEGAECDEYAYYSPSEKKITICYQFVDDILNDGYALYPDDADRAEGFAYNVLDGILLHETGHALVDIHDLPITGLEEDAVDQFAALIQSRTYGDYDPGYETGRNMMLDVADWWDYNADDPPLYWDVHSLNIQRFYNIACYAYGADPEYNSGLMGDEYLPPERAKNCQYEYNQMSSSWDRLLDGYLIE